MASESVTLFLLCTLIMMTVKILMNLSRRKIYNLPPGPTPLPIIGNLHILDIDRQDFTFMELAKKYGPVFTFHFGPMKAVVVVGYEANKEALTSAKYELGDRGVFRIADDFQQNHGVFLANGESWKVLRRFMLFILRDLGMGKRPIEGKIIEELQFINADIASYNGKPFDKKVFYQAAPNITYGMLFGRRFDYKSETFKKIITIMDDIVVHIGNPAAKMYNSFPILKYFLKGPGRVMGRIDQLNEILRGLFKEAKEVKSEDSFRTFAEAFLQKDDREIVTDEKEKVFTEKHLLASAFDLMLGGTETTSTTIQWAILLMMKYPHIQNSVSVYLALSTLLVLITRSKKYPYNFPPGPTPLPLIGNLYLLDFRRQDLSLLKLSEKYGPIFTIHLGMNKAVVLTGLETIKEALVEEADTFSDRAFFPIFHDIQGGNGVFFSSGEMWRTTRRFTISSLKNLGMGKKHIEDKIVEELQFMTDKIESYAGQPFKLREFTCGPTNVTLAMLFGSRFDYTDPIFMQLLDLIYHTFILLGSPPLKLYFQLYNMFPMLGKFLKSPKIVLEKLGQICKVLKTDIQFKRGKIDLNSLRSFIETLVAKQEEEKTNKDSLFHDNNILATVLDLVMAGTETTSTTLHWGILLMVKYPQIQKKVQREIHSILESGRLPKFEDRNAMPYTQAVIHEVQRFANVIPHLAHATSKDTYLKGYHIPKPVRPQAIDVVGFVVIDPAD